MECKRCKSPLPFTGYVCLNCGMMMSEEQIKLQKENMKMNSNINTQMISEKYGHKDFIYKKREETKPKYIGILILVAIICVILILTLFVYFK